MEARPSCIWLALLTAGSLAIAQDQPETEAEESQSPEQIEQEILGPERNPTMDSALSGARDPFQPVFDAPRGEGPTVRRPRPPGVEGMDIQELELVGIVMMESGNIAFFNGTDNLGYFLRAGDRVYDGRLVQIERDRVVFEQEISGTPGRRTREVIMRLQPLT